MIEVESFLCCNICYRKLVGMHRNTTTVFLCCSFTVLLISFTVVRGQEITGGKGVDVAVEALGKPQTFLQCTKSVKDGGKAVFIGLTAAGAIGEVDINRLVRRKVSMFNHVS